MSSHEEYAVRSIMRRYSRNAELDEFMEKELREAGYGGVDMVRTPVGTRINLYVSRPGLVIGRRGTGIRELTEKVEKRFGLPNPQISVSEVEVPELNPRIVAQRVAHTISRGTGFRRAAIWALNTVMNAGALGCEIEIGGKLRSERSRRDKYTEGVIPKSGDSSERVVRQGKIDVLMKMGLYGIKVRIALKENVPREVRLLSGPAEAPEAEVLVASGGAQVAEAKA